MNKPSEKTINLMLEFMKKTSLPKIIQAMEQKQKIS